MYIRITKEFNFEMAHALPMHEGPCKNIHGHSYTLSVTLKGCPIKESSNPSSGMILDFSELKKIVSSEIIDHFDHSLVLYKNTDPDILSSLSSHKIILFDEYPSCENLLIYFSKRLINKIPSNASLCHLMLRETKTSYAEWYASDNM
jgi:6-pyruvoyltetrahydropterin/6-carboxytetrahydropterin synthase